MTSIGKAMYILKRLGEPPYELGITELSRELDMVKSGVHKLLAELASESFVVKNTHTRKYRLGPALFRLGSIYGSMRGIGEISQSVMEAISKVTGTSVLVGLRDADEAFLAYKVDPPGSFSYEGHVGRKFPLHAGALGKILGAYMEPSRIREILSVRGIEKRTNLTISSLNEILESYDEIRRQGYALTLGENISGAFGLAVPIYDRNHDVWACLCVAGPKEFYDESKKEAWIRLLREGAKDISYKLGFRE